MVTIERCPDFYIARSMPTGDMPERLREPWIGVPLPVIDNKIYRDTPSAHIEGVRNPGVITEGLVDIVYVETDKALDGLRAFGFDEAAEEWNTTLRRRYGATSHISTPLRRRAANIQPLAFVVRPEDELLDRFDVWKGFDESGAPEFGASYIVDQLEVRTPPEARGFARRITSSS